MGFIENSPWILETVHSFWASTRGLTRISAVQSLSQDWVIVAQWCESTHRNANTRYRSMLPDVTWLLAGTHGVIEHRIGVHGSTGQPNFVLSSCYVYAALMIRLVPCHGIHLSRPEFIRCRPHTWLNDYNCLCPVFASTLRYGNKILGGDPTLLEWIFQ